MSSFALRLLALLAMFADHAGLALFPAIGAFRCVGRLSFPIYCFLLVQGFTHTHDLRAYARRLLLFALVSEVPFDLLIFGRLASPVEQNVLFSLLFGLMALYAARALPPLKAAIINVTLCMAAMAARVSYGWLGVALCLSVYYAGASRVRLLVCMGGALLLYSMSLSLSGVTHSWVLVSFCALLALAPLLSYNGKRGPRHPTLTALFYAAYPLHLLLLYLIRAMRLVPPYFLN